MNQKYVLITGASRGIGRACALAFARNHFHVFLNCRHSLDALQQVEKEILDEHGSCTLLPGNAGNPDDVRKMFAIIESICPGLDVLVNNAGISFVGLLQDMSDAQWSEILNTNLSSVFYCC
ncbi:MAG: SDR family NAD(P)-dependent oxidoreductase, partial [Mediterraneibacter gnavus]